MIDQIRAERSDGAAFAPGRRSKASATRTNAESPIHSTATYASKPRVAQAALRTPTDSSAPAATASSGRASR